MQFLPGLQMERGVWKAAGPFNLRLHTPSFHSDTIDLTGQQNRGYLNQLDNQAEIWLQWSTLGDKFGENEAQK